MCKKAWIFLKSIYTFFVYLSSDDLFLRSHPCQVGPFHFLHYCALEQNQNRDGAPDLPSLVSGDHHHDYLLRVWLIVNMKDDGHSDGSMIMPVLKRMTISFHLPDQSLSHLPGRQI